MSVENNIHRVCTAAEPAISPQDFARHVQACNEIMFNIRSYSEQVHGINQYLEKMIGDTFWREPVRVMAMGGYYYGADTWMKAHAYIKELNHDD